MNCANRGEIAIGERGILPTAERQRPLYGQVAKAGSAKFSLEESLSHQASTPMLGSLTNDVSVERGEIG